MTRVGKFELEPNDILFGQKTLLLFPGLSSGARQVGGTILDHFNKKTGRCDPGLDRLAALTGLDKKTVTNAIQELTCPFVCLYHRKRHGGYMRRTAYRPNFGAFRSFVAEWDDGMKTGKAPTLSAKFARKKIRNSIDEQIAVKAWPDNDQAEGEYRNNFPGNRGKNCPETGEKIAHKPIEITHRNNPSKDENLADAHAHASKPDYRRGQVNRGGKFGYRRIPIHSINGRKANGNAMRSIEAANESATARWVNELTRLGVLVKLNDAIDPILAAQATVEEREKRGAGVKLILEKLSGCSSFQGGEQTSATDRDN